MKKNSKTFIENVKQYFSPIKSEPIIALKSFIMYSLRGINPIIHILFIQKLVSLLELGTENDFKAILLYYIVYACVYEVADFSVRKWGWVESINSYRKHIDKEYINKFLQVDNNVVEKEGTGKLVSIITSGTDIWALSLDKIIMELAKIIYVFVFSAVMIFYVNDLFLVLFLIFYFLVFSLGAFINSKAAVYRRERHKIWNMYVKSIVKIIMSKNEILQSGNSQTEINKLYKKADEITSVNRAMATYVHLFFRLSESSVMILKIVVLAYVGLGIFHGDFTLAFFVGFFGVTTLLESVIKQSMVYFRNFTNDYSKIEILWEFFEKSPTMKGYDTGETFNIKNGDISLKSLTFGYSKKQAIFKNFDLDIIGGKVTALVGPSGGGKSTLIKLIAGYIHSDMGNLSIDGQNISDVSLKSYYKHVGYLTQEPNVFDGSIRENLSYSLEGTVDDSKLDEILELSQCQFIYDLEYGLDTEIGERGVRLSGGQKQRLAIAKIFLKNPKIILLDEPTSALDSISEKQISIAMQKLFENRTVIVIAHRLQTVKHADEIIYIENGKIAERGNHKQLVKQKGLYNEMLELQSGF